MRVREEVFNVVLAQLLSRRGLVAVPEGMDRGGRRPDVVVNFYGLRLIIEGKVDERGAESHLAEQAEGRLEDGLGHVVLAVLYPRELREQDPESLEKALEGASFRVRVFSEAGGDDWMEVRGISELAEHLRRVRERRRFRPHRDTLGHRGPPWDGIFSLPFTSHEVPGHLRLTADLPMEELGRDRR
jgi:hypothetical protein